MISIAWYGAKAIQSYGRRRRDVGSGEGAYLHGDELLLEAGSLMVHAAYRDNDVDCRLVRPGDHGLPRIGHSGFFRPSAEAALVPLVAEWLATRSSATRARHANEM